MVGCLWCIKLKIQCMSRHYKINTKVHDSGSHKLLEIYDIKVSFKGTTIGNSMMFGMHLFMNWYIIVSWRLFDPGPSVMFFSTVEFLHSSHVKPNDFVYGVIQALAHLPFIKASCPCPLSHGILTMQLLHSWHGKVWLG